MRGIESRLDKLERRLPTTEQKSVIHLARYGVDCNIEAGERLAEQCDRTLVIVLYGKDGEPHIPRYS